jgi:hypothetical protein
MDPEVYDLLWNHCDDEVLAEYEPRHKATTRERRQRKKSNKLPPPIGKHSHWAMAATLNAQLHPIENLEERRQKALQLYHEQVLGIELPFAQDDDDDNGDGVKEWTDDCTLAYRKFLMSSSRALSQGWTDLYIDDYSLFAPVSSLEDEHMNAYLNREDVKKALHVEETPIDKWPFPKAGFDYTKEYNACNWQDEIRFPNVSMVDIYQDIVPKLELTWIYNGNTDPCVSYEGTREAVKQILQPEMDGGGKEK